MRLVYQSRQPQAPDICRLDNVSRKGSGNVIFDRGWLFRIRSYEPEWAGAFLHACALVDGFGNCVCDGNVWYRRRNICLDSTDYSTGQSFEVFDIDTEPCIRRVGYEQIDVGFDDDC